MRGEPEWQALFRASSLSLRLEASDAVNGAFALNACERDGRPRGLRRREWIVDEQPLILFAPFAPLDRDFPAIHHDPHFTAGIIAPIGDLDQCAQKLVVVNVDNFVWKMSSAETTVEYQMI